MKSLVIALLIMVITYFVLNFFGKINTEKQLDLNSAISQCSRNLDQNQCTVDKIMSVIKVQSTRNLDQPVLWSVENNLIDISSGRVVNINTSEISRYQLDVWNSYLMDSKKKQGYKFMNDNGLIGIALIIIYILVALWAVFALVPFIWRFFLKRVSEVSKAVKGDKLD
jgi:hypothetical protein